MASQIARRTLITRLGAAGMALSTGGLLIPARAQSTDRAELARTRDGVTCENGSVLVSGTAERKATTALFDSAGSCRMTPAALEGPYFVCVNNSRKDITDGQTGVPLTIALRVQDADCNPIPDAIVDLWGCNAEGVYSAFAGDPDEEYRGGLVEITQPTRFLRGVLASDADGIVEFDTIYPSFYAGRAIHMHFKVHIGNQAYLTSQALFPEEMNSRILQTAPYNGPRGTPRLLNTEDPDFIGDIDTFNVAEQGSDLVAVLNLVLS